jgi:hypothetical protein
MMRSEKILTRKRNRKQICCFLDKVMSDQLEVFAAELTDWSFLTTVEELLAILTTFLPNEVECNRYYGQIILKFETWTPPVKTRGSLALHN